MIFFISLLLVLLALILHLSNGEPIPITDEQGNPIPGSISEKVNLDINGIKQGMFIKSYDEANPVLLFLHGGPGMPEYFLTQDYPTGLEKSFTVVWWDQRGAGLSYNTDIPTESMSVNQLVEDTIEVTNYLRDRFRKEKIYLMGHSGGSFIGLKTAERAPDLYYAYIGIAQMSYQLKSENLAYKYMIEEYTRIGNTKMVEKLKNSPPGNTLPISKDYLKIRDDAMHRLGIGTTRNMKSVISGVFYPSWLHKEYTFQEKVNIWKGKVFSANLLRDEMFSTDLTIQVGSLDLPVYFFHGIYDFTSSYDLARDYFESLDAPLKGFYTFEQSAHSPIFEEPAKMMDILQKDVLSGVNYMADE